jgi:integrase
MGKGKHPVNALNAMGISKLSAPGRYADGNGLHLVIDKSGAKRWVLRTVVRGRRRDMGLGGVRTVSLAQARVTAQRYRATARSGGDPLEERRRENKSVPSFEKAAFTVHAGLVPSWKNPKHAVQWINTLKRYAFPVIGSRPVSQITSADVLRILSPIWIEKPETAKRLSQRISAVIRWARASEFYTGDDPVEAARAGLPRQNHDVQHHASLHFEQVPELIRKLRACSAYPESKLALEFLILTAARTKEVLEAKWDEVDLEKRLWVVPAIRMKMEETHRVPLTSHAMKLLEQARALSPDSEFIFPNQTTGKPLSYNTLLFVVQRRLGLATTVHGLRSSFKDWASETTKFPNEVSEMALSHKISSKVESAYRRGDLLEKRRQLMGAWTDYVCGNTGWVVAEEFGSGSG